MTLCFLCGAIFTSIHLIIFNRQTVPANNLQSHYTKISNRKVIYKINYLNWYVRRIQMLCRFTSLNYRRKHQHIGSLVRQTRMQAQPSTCDVGKLL